MQVGSTWHEVAAATESTRQGASFNGAEGISDIEGKTTRVGASERGQRTSFNGAEGISDIEGKATRVGASERGQRTSFKPFSRNRLTRTKC
jgi:hypothetical protein